MSELDFGRPDVLRCREYLLVGSLAAHLIQLLHEGHTECFPAVTSNYPGDFAPWLGPQTRKCLGTDPPP